MNHTDTIDKINKLKHEKNAIILAHNYQAVEIQDIADYTGDSLQLSVLASKCDNPLIIFCGVRFMAETAAILNPKAKVILPVADAGCPMADMISDEQLRQFKALHPGAVVVCYVNSSVEVKAESDICCTSSNALKIIQSIPTDKEILFVPDQNLGSWAGRQAGREVITYNGYCPVHHFGFNLDRIKQLRQQYPGYTLLAHPECPQEVVDNADMVMSTGGMLKYAESNDKLIIATEHAMVAYMNHLYPHKKIVPLNPGAICKNMLKTSLDDVLNALQTETTHIEVASDVAEKALHSLQRMLDLS